MSESLKLNIRDLMIRWSKLYITLFLPLYLGIMYNIFNSLLKNPISAFTYTVMSAGIFYLIISLFIIIALSVKNALIINFSLHLTYMFTLPQICELYYENSMLRNKALFKLLIKNLIKKVVYEYSKWISGRDILKDDCDIILKSLKKAKEFRREKNRIVESIESMKTDASDKPLVIYANPRHATAKTYFKNWDFIVYLLPSIRFRRRGNKYVLQIPLEEARWAIYNNAGKWFIYEEFLPDINDKNIMDLSLNTHNNIVKREKSFNITTYLRWASGGLIPIVKYRGKYYVVLFYRNFKPMCWNFPLGASESLEELINPEQLMFREALEEIVVLDRRPERDTEVIQKIIFPSSMFKNVIENLIIQYIEKYVKKHISLRRQQDHLYIKWKHEERQRKSILKRIEAYSVNTPYSVEICSSELCSLYECEEKTCNYINDILYIVNPFELGIEVVRPIIFELDDNDYILWGEIWKTKGVLPRTPVLLLSIDYIKEAIEDGNGSFGEVYHKGECLDCRIIKEIPSNTYRVFTKDIEFLKHRINYLNRKIRRTPIEDDELIHLRTWFIKYQAQIEYLRLSEETSKKDLHIDRCKAFLVFCPTVWKAFELMYHVGIFDRLKVI